MERSRNEPDESLELSIGLELGSCIEKLSRRDQELISQIDWNTTETSPAESAALDRLIGVYKQRESKQRNNIA
jgi:hypothetical protein